jgi:hypothetical protein
VGKRSTWTSKNDDQLRALAASGENSVAIAGATKSHSSWYSPTRQELGRPVGRFQERAGAEGEEVRRLTLSEIAYWLMGARAVLVVLGIVAFAFSDDPARCQGEERLSAFRGLIGVLYDLEKGWKKTNNAKTWTSDEEGDFGSSSSPMPRPSTSPHTYGEPCRR